MHSKKILSKSLNDDIVLSFYLAAQNFFEQLVMLFDFLEFLSF